MKIEASLSTTTINKGSTLRIKSKLKGEEVALQEPELITKAMRSQIDITTKNSHSIMKITVDPSITTMSHHREVDPLEAWEVSPTHVLILNNMKDTMNQMSSSQRRETIMVILTDNEKALLEFELAEGKLEWEEQTEGQHIIIIKKPVMNLVRKGVVMINPNFKNTSKDSLLKLLNQVETHGVVEAIVVVIKNVSTETLIELLYTSKLC